MRAARTTRRVRTGFAAAIGAALLLPGALFADTPQPAPRPAQGAPPSPAPAPAAAARGDGAAAATAPPHAALAITPTPAAAGKDVRLDAGASTGTTLRYAWDLDGNGSFETDGGTQAVLVRRFTSGTFTLAVRVTDASGRTADAARQLSVSAPAAPPPVVTKTVVHRQALAATRVPVRAAASSAVTIQNFAFSPGAVTVKAGGTVTWTNRDGVPHTATAGDGSFDTGTLKHGASGSHTFTKAGTIAYICAIHPSMHGTVVVTAAAGGSQSGSGPRAGNGTGTSAAPAPSATAPSGPTLPNTGVDVLAVVLTGLAFTGGGAGLRRLLEGRG